MSTRADVVVVGGGLAGLATACLAAETGHRVQVLERSAELGGRARSRRGPGFALNLGPHALYAGGAAERVLARLGVPMPGFSPPFGGLALHGGDLHTMPTGLLGGSEHLALAARLARLAVTRRSTLRGRTVSDWIGTSDPPRVRALLGAMVRLATYVDAPEILPATVAVDQLRRVARTGVRYVDGGWQTLVNGLADVARARGVEIATDHPVGRLDEIRARAVVVALPPRAARALLPELPAPRFEGRAACLDLVLDRLPVPEHRFVLGVDQPLYFSVHTRSGIGGPVVLHVARYRRPDDATPREALREELEELTDRVQPGWRSHAMQARFLPDLLVTPRIPSLEALPPALPPGVFLAGDAWGPGLLADAALASAETAAASVAGYLAGEAAA